MSHDYNVTAQSWSLNPLHTT